MGGLGGGWKINEVCSTTNSTNSRHVITYALLQKWGEKMKIRNVSIQNFRGIKKLDWSLPEQNLFCLIGNGDSGKTTILEAIRCAFNPQWNLAFSDSDFHLCKTNNPIVIEIIIGELPDEFCSEKKYGAHLRGWDKVTYTLHDEPEDHDACGTILLDDFRASRISKPLSKTSKRPKVEIRGLSCMPLMM